jgi:2-C-methyl-D-erythritol 2,4-cyclodiphosphate synthase
MDALPPAPATNSRIGHGHDLHRLQPGGRLLLGGIVVSTELSPIAHSDGDVVIHALVDALLGALCLGDIGEHFSNTDPRWKNAPSQLFLDHTLTLMRAAGWRVVNADILILAERPRISPHKPAIAKNLADLLQAPVNIKAGTNEGCDAIGQGEAIAATAVVLLTRC